MPHQGYADPVMNDRPGFHSNVPVSELTEHVTRAIEASDVSSASLVVRNHGWGNVQNSTDPYQAQWAQGLKIPKRLGCAQVHDSDSPDLTARPMPRSTTLTRPIPRRA